MKARPLGAKKENEPPLSATLIPSQIAGLRQWIGR